MTRRISEPGESAALWVSTRERMPGRGDADLWGCVLIWDKYNGCMITGWQNRNRLEAETVTHWARLPEEPGEGGK